MAKVKVRKAFVYDKKGPAKWGEYQQMIRDFVNSDARVCVIKYTLGDSYKTIHSVYTSAGHAVNRSGENLKAHIRGDRIFLEKVI